ncbi:hypothetical protein BLS_002925 [Venturia inaequalis]|uniref:Uncharacterized protein n=1 Tax=Venturia inaequalis TaxID=5025 RepID=A0A8H3ULA9_VENIN|nr:hypothetical protein EG328_005702 [Venturia inaequalis]KAE9974775.1 hypothetical protein BLS_002925 [Venturia inaequalis]KAE9982430.1 hypothetical protein EG327_005829 [Venturia inaequalis]
MSRNDNESSETCLRGGKWRRFVIGGDEALGSPSGLNPQFLSANAAQRAKTGEIDTGFDGKINDWDGFAGLDSLVR